MNRLLRAMAVAGIGIVPAAGPGSAHDVLLAQVPAQTPAPTGGAPEWQRPNAATADYAAGAKKEIDAIAGGLADARQRANETGRQDRLRKLERVEQNLRTAREQWERLPQTNQANWETVRKNFEIAYDDLRKSWDEASRM